MTATKIDAARLEQFMQRAVDDLGAAISAPLVRLGQRLGLYRAMARAGPLSSAEVAARAGCDARMTREWLANQAAGGYLTHDPDADTWELPDEHALALADEDSPFYLLGAFDVIASLWADEDKLAEAFRTGGGLSWHEHDHRLFHGAKHFFRAGYRAHLVGDCLALGAKAGEKRLTDVLHAAGFSRIRRASETPSTSP